MNHEQAACSLSQAIPSSNNYSTHCTNRAFPVLQVPEFSAEALPTPESLAALAAGALSWPALRAVLVLGALEAAPQSWLAEEGEAVSPGRTGIPRCARPPFLAAASLPSQLLPPPLPLAGPSYRHPSSLCWLAEPASQPTFPVLPLPLLQGLASIFTTLAAQQPAGDSRALEALVRRVAEVAPASELLSSIFALPPEAAPGAGVQVPTPPPLFLCRLSFSIPNRPAAA